MKKFKVFKNAVGDIKAIKQGWCWPAFFFDIFWAMVSNLWGILGVLLIAFVVMNFFMGLFRVAQNGEAVIGISAIVAKIVFGVSGNKWREGKLLSKGFELKQIVMAASRGKAVALFKQNKEVVVTEKG